METIIGTLATIFGPPLAAAVSLLSIFFVLFGWWLIPILIIAAFLPDKKEEN